MEVCIDEKSLKITKSIKREDDEDDEGGGPSRLGIKMRGY